MIRLSPLLLLVGCATTPTPNFQAERAQIYSRNDVLCFVASNQNIKDQYPQMFDEATQEIIRRGTVCNPEMIDTGARAIVTQAERERRVTAMQSQERQESASRVGDKILRGLVGFATGYAIGSAISPPPATPAFAPVVRCTTSYAGSQAYTTCQ